MGQYFKKIENDSKLKNLHDRFNNYRSTNYNSQYWDGTKNLKTSYNQMDLVIL